MRNSFDKNEIADKEDWKWRGTLGRTHARRVLIHNPSQSGKKQTKLFFPFRKVGMVSLFFFTDCVSVPLCVCQGNKGGVSVRFSFYGHMVCFLNCHLAAHMNYALQRVDEFEYILETQDFDLLDTPHVLDHKSVHVTTNTANI